LLAILDGLPRHFKETIILLAAMGCIVTTGCFPAKPHSNKPRGGITLFVTYGTIPVTSGEVNLYNVNTGEAAGGQLNAQGELSLSDVVAGTYTVTLLPPDDSPSADPEASSSSEQSRPDIPERFRRSRTSPLSIEVKEKTQSEFRFDLKEGDR